MDRIQIDPGENIVLKLRKHWILFVRDAFGTLCLGFAPFVVIGILVVTNLLPQNLTISVSNFSFASALWLLIIWMTLFVLWTNYYLDMWIVTDRRIFNIDQVSPFRRHVATWSLNRIQEITVRTENILQTAFQYGSIEIQTAGPTDEYARVEGIPDPDRVRTTMLECVSRYKVTSEAVTKDDTGR